MGCDRVVMTNGTGELLNKAVVDYSKLLFRIFPGVAS